MPMTCNIPLVITWLFSIICMILVSNIPHYTVNICTLVITEITIVVIGCMIAILVCFEETNIRLILLSALAGITLICCTLLALAVHIEDYSICY